MTDRKIQVLDAALRVLGTRGLRQLTHRTVDAEAGLPLGSASNCFRTREALVEGVLERLLELETKAWEQLAGDLRPLSPADFAAVVGSLVRAMLGPARELTLACHAIFHEASFHPGLQQKINAAREHLAIWGVPWVAQLGSTHPERDYRILLHVIDGLLLNQLAGPLPDFNPEETILACLNGILAGGQA